MGIYIYKYIFNNNNNKPYLESRKRPFHHDNNNNDSMTQERAEKLRRINEIEVMLRELKEEALLDNNNNNKDKNKTKTKSHDITTSPARNITTRTTTMRQPSKFTATTTTTATAVTSVVDDDSRRIQRSRMDALEQRIEAIQAQVRMIILITTHSLFSDREKFIFIYILTINIIN